MKVEEAVKERQYSKCPKMDCEHCICNAALDHCGRHEHAYCELCKLEDESEKIDNERYNYMEVGKVAGQKMGMEQAKDLVSAENCLCSKRIEKCMEELKYHRSETLLEIAETAIKNIAFECLASSTESRARQKVGEIIDLWDAKRKKIESEVSCNE